MKKIVFFLLLSCIGLNAQIFPPSTWTLLPAPLNDPTNPTNTKMPPLTEASMSIFGKQGISLILFGGRDRTQTVFDNTYGYNVDTNPESWILRSEPIHPEARYGASMCNIAKSQSFLEGITGEFSYASLFAGGGQGTSLFSCPLWEFQFNKPLFGKTTPPSWTSVPCSGPSPRKFAAMAADSSSFKAILFGGTTGAAAQANGETWQLMQSFNFSNFSIQWQQLNINGPSPRFGSSMAFDEINGQYLLFGGLKSDGKASNETWIFSQGAWTNVTPSNTSDPSQYPPKRYHAMMAYDPSIAAIVMFGGRDELGNIYSDTWAYYTFSPPNKWVKLTPRASPSKRYSSCMASTTKGLRLFGGTQNITPPLLITNETWGLIFDNPSPPTDVQVTQPPVNTQTIKSKQCQSKVINILTWKPPVKRKNIIAYEVYSDPDLVNRLAIIPAKKPLKFIEKAKPCKRYTYFVVSVNRANVRSAAVSATIKGKKLCKKQKKCLKEHSSSSESSSG